MTALLPSSARLVDAALFDLSTDAPHLLGSRCIDCSAVDFPARPSCSRCTGERMEPHVLADRGLLWGFTIQGFPPKTPYLAAGEKRFTPYGVGYVNLRDEVLVETRILADRPEQLAIGMAMELVLDPFFTRDDGTAVLTFAFRPVQP